MMLVTISSLQVMVSLLGLIDVVTFSVWIFMCFSCVVEVSTYMTFGIFSFFQNFSKIIPIYLVHHFWVGMRSTQRRESMHAFFNKFITRNSSLIQFVKQERERERESDAADFHTHVYTHEKFREVQAPFRGKVNCITRSTQFVLGFTIYEVVEQISNSTFNKFITP
ncbi:hypothetical protein Ahy_B01g055851 [Arachis hypogaea]|uniref:Protein FAR1-RELATED SEQUENCE n=1 Tax=Arachis hypogaea TaxID=3818 RepID=A0A445AXA7_ARAHY|nr:hypothetical protein Ahy_B01g055851 [Arachis hypogaea]